MRINNKKRIDVKKCKNIIIAFALLFLTVCSIPVWGFETQDGSGVQYETITEVIHENPLYGGAGTQYRTTTVPKEKQDFEADSFSGYALESVPYYNSIDAASRYFRTCMRNRITEITLAIPTTKETVLNDITAIYQRALNYEMDGKATDGDYLRFSYGYIYCKDTKVQDDKSASKWTLHYTVYYYTSAQQEQELSAAISSVVQKLSLSGLPEKERIKKIYDYICSNVVYDHGTYPNYSGEKVRKGEITLKAYMDSKGLFTAYNAMFKGKAVCQGYATLLYRMLMEAGIRNRIILGSAGGVSHAWNIVKAGALYYNVDSTWDAGKKEYSYFLKAQNEFPNHTRNSTVGSNKMDYTSIEFQMQYPTAGVTLLPVDQIRFSEEKEYYEYTGSAITPEVIVPGLVRNVDYSVSYTNNIEIGTLSVKIQGIGCCMGSCELKADIAKALPINKISLKEKKNVYEYTGKAILPEIQADGLIKNQDYKISYTDNIKPGIMSVCIEGIGKYRGRKVIKCQIFQTPNVGKVGKVTMEVTSSAAIKLSWSSAANATGYQMYYYDSAQKKYIKYFQGSAKACVFKGDMVKAGSVYRVMVRPYYQNKVTYDGVTTTFTKYGANSDSILVATRPTAPSLKNLTVIGGKIRASWERLTASNGYQIQISTDPKFAADKTNIYRIEKNTVTYKDFNVVRGVKLKKNTRYYVRVRAYRNGGTAVYGAWSTVKNIIYK